VLDLVKSTVFLLPFFLAQRRRLARAVGAAAVELGRVLIKLRLVTAT
jgi:hypothetical protein